MRELARTFAIGEIALVGDDHKVAPLGRVPAALLQVEIDGSIVGRNKFWPLCLFFFCDGWQQLRRGKGARRLRECAPCAHGAQLERCTATGGQGQHEQTTDGGQPHRATPRQPR